MNFLLSLLAPSQPPCHAAILRKRLHKLNLHSPSPLPEYFCQLLMESTSDGVKPRQIFKEILRLVTSASSAC